MTILYGYHNGNCKVTLHDDGRKERSWPNNEAPKPEFPESIDLKITDYCDKGCRWCHESSTKDGKHALIDVIFRAIKGLPSGVEIAIGGGNPLDHPKLESILEKLTENGLIANLTVHGAHVFAKSDWLKNLQRAGVLNGVGISDPVFYKLMHGNDMLPDHSVCHMIVGVHDPHDVIKIRSGDSNVLVLGYKTFGRGTEYYSKEVAANIARWKYFIGDILRAKRGILSFDNLALDQLDIKNLVPEEVWSQYYMGNDGSFSMYFDAVLNQYAVSSTSQRRDAQEICEQMNIQQMFCGLV